MWAYVGHCKQNTKLSPRAGRCDTLPQTPALSSVLRGWPTTRMAGITHSRSTARGVFALFLLLVALIVPSLTNADARTDFLVRMLRTSDQFRVRAQAALALARVQNDPNVTRALVDALRDDNAAVRAAAAASLETVGDPTAIDGLRGVLNDRDSGVRAAAQRSIRALERVASSRPPPNNGGGVVPPPTTGEARFYIGIGSPGAQATVAPAVLQRARTFLVSSVGQMQGVAVAPDGERANDASAVLTRRHLTGCFLEASITSVEVRPDGGLRAAVSVTVYTYPGRELRSMLTGAATIQGAGASDETREQAIQAAITSALRRLPQALEAAAAREGATAAQR